LGLVSCKAGRSPLSILFVRFKCGKLRCYLWKTVPFNSLCEILWESDNDKSTGVCSFNSLCEILRFAQQEGVLYSTFNSLCEIRSDTPAPCLQIVLSILFVRFRAVFSWWEKWQKTFNSLCEILGRLLWMACWGWKGFQFSLWDSWDKLNEPARAHRVLSILFVRFAKEVVKLIDEFRSFNSLCEIHNTNKKRYKIDVLNFQFSLWDSPPSLKLKLFLFFFFQFSLWDSHSHVWPNRFGRFFQFSLWDSDDWRLLSTYFAPLSILFVRFIAETSSRKPPAISFNSLCEIRHL